MTDLCAIEVADLTGVFPTGFFITLMKALQDARVLGDFGVVSIRSVELFAILVPRHKHLWCPRECTH